MPTLRATPSAGITSTRFTPSAHWAVTTPAIRPSPVRTGLPTGAGSVRSSSRKRCPFIWISSEARTPRLMREPRLSPKRTVQEDAGTLSPQERSCQASRRDCACFVLKKTRASWSRSSGRTAAASQICSPSVTASWSAGISFTVIGAMTMPSLTGIAKETQDGLSSP